MGGVIYELLSKQAVKAPVGVIADSALLMPGTNRLITTNLAFQGV